MAGRDKRARERIRWAEEQQRRTILERARELARSGRYPGSESIVAELQTLDGFELARARLEEAEVREQLDRLCDVARNIGGT
jgi:hypothetical protein